jgi:hypothetical protein
MADENTQRITERELREAELQMTGRIPASATGFIGFVPAGPSPNGAALKPAGSTSPSGK